MKYSYKARKWSFGIHLAASAFIVLLADLLIYAVARLSPFLPIAVSPKQAQAIGIIGAADGPTSIFVASSFSGFDFFAIIDLCFLVVLLLMYFPLTKIRSQQNIG